MALPDTPSISIFLNIFIAVLSFIGLLVIYGLYVIIIKPLIEMQHYRRQGIDCKFFPLIGDFQKVITSLKEHGDAKHYVKERSVTHPCKITCSNLGTSAYVTLYDPALIKAFFMNTDNYEKDPTYLALYNHLLGRGLLTSEGAHWKAHRKILSNVFHFEFLRNNLPNIHDTIKTGLKDFKNQSLTKLNILVAFQAITGQVIGRIFFGEQLNQYKLEGKPLTYALSEIMAVIGLLSLSLERYVLGIRIIEKGVFARHRKLMNQIKAFRAVCSDIIEERKKMINSGERSTNEKDMLDHLLAIKDQEMTDDDIIDEFVTFFLAGMDTTAHVVLMAVYYVNKYPEYKAKVLAEAKELYANGNTVTMDGLNNMEFTMALLKETLRYSSPVPGLFPRKAVKDHKVGEYDIKTGTLLNVDFFYNTFNEKYFKETSEFNPMRWYEKQAVEPYAYTPFAAGPRNCIGQHLALLEARLLLADFLLMYDFKLQEGYNLQMGFTFLYEPFVPILLDLTEKNK